MENCYMRTKVKISEDNKSQASSHISGSTQPASLKKNDCPETIPQRNIQGTVNNYTPTTSFPIQKKENNTGLPGQLKSGIENLSGYAMDDVKVHYHSSKPAQMQAHAFARGTDIHIASGQEKHLPHEAWHVVQQKQGRVKPTFQMKNGARVNDNKSLEDEADNMGSKALRYSAKYPDRFTSRQNRSSQQVQRAVIQREKYMRATNSDARIANEVNSLRRIFTGEIYRQNSVNTWVDGFAGMPTTRYNPGQTHYYSPVGYMLEVNNNADVLANFSGDGNTNNIPTTHIKWIRAIKEVVDDLKNIPEYLAWFNENVDFAIDDTQAVTQVFANGLYTMCISDYLDELRDENTVQSRGILNNALARIKNVAGAHIAAHYDDDTQARFLGTGRNPDGMEEAEDSEEVPYTESILHAKFEQVTAAWYNPNFGAYSDAQAGEAGWRNAHGDWLAARRNSARYIKQQFDQHGSNLDVIALNKASDTSGGGGGYVFSDDGDHFTITHSYTTYLGQARQTTSRFSLIEIRDAEISYEVVDEGIEVRISRESSDYTMTVSRADTDQFREIISRFIRRNSKHTSKEGGDSYSLQFDPANLSIKREYRTYLGAPAEHTSTIGLETITGVEFEWADDKVETSITYGSSTYTIQRSLEKTEAIRRILIRSGLSEDIIGAIPQPEEV
ncbi:MAG: DUF4157 domain-containing protein [Balneolaceae bacterium]|nr:DUF4157 domain-containing protein [Balneolaceae bacterium]